MLSTNNQGRGKSPRKKSGKENLHTAKLKELLVAYESKCSLGKWKVDSSLKDQIKSSISQDVLITKLILNGGDEFCLTPVIQAVRKCWYKPLKELYLCKLQVPYEQIAVLSDFMEQPSYQLSYLELFGCSIDPYSFKRLSKGLLQNKTLTTLVLDHTRLGEEGLTYLQDGIIDTRHLLKLSLAYCQLEKHCGKILGKIVFASSIAELYLDGNMLECEGLLHLIQNLADNAECEKLKEANAVSSANKNDGKEVINTAVSDLNQTLEDDRETRLIISLNETSSNSAVTGNEVARNTNQKSKKKKAKKLTKDLPPKIGAFLKILHIPNNGIDQMSSSNALYTPYDVMQVLRRWIANDGEIKEINLEDNLITELGARELIAGLEQRKQAGFPAIHMRVTHRISPVVFKQIIALASGVKKSRKSKKKRAAGKKRV